MKVFKYSIILLLFFSQFLYSQSSLFDNDENSSTDAEEDSREYSELPGGYRSIDLGMDFEKVKELLLTEPRFDFRGDPDVSIQKKGDQSLISSKGRAFIDQGFFQFNENSLYLIILNLDRERMDFYSVQKTLTDKYGDPDDLSPEGLFWRNDSVQFSLEYPLTLKYLDLQVFNSFIEEDVRLKSFQEISRTEFLEDF
ncbi:MAG: hypothetical protein PQJ58_23115 [Spirochaetales bacterium]|nr:hypothetical protein [Spirochaetales bacterium]